MYFLISPFVLLLVCLLYDFYKGNEIKIIYIPFFLFNIGILSYLSFDDYFKADIKEFNIYIFINYVFITEFMLYFQHYLFHFPIFYHIHKLHHENIHSTACNALYLNPLELLVMYACYYLWKTEKIHVCIYHVISFIINGILNHGNYFKYHSAHHSNPNYNYGSGVFGFFFDKIFLTAKK